MQDIAEIGDIVEYTVTVKKQGRVTAADNYGLLVDSDFFTHGSVRIVTPRALKVGDILDHPSRAMRAFAGTVVVAYGDAYAKHSDGYWYRTKSPHGVADSSMASSRTKVIHIP